jgi:hypothetical protein
MGAMLAASQLVCDSSSQATQQQQQEALSAYASYSLFAQSLLGQLFRMWLAATSSEMKPLLALPPHAQIEALLKQQAGQQRGATLHKRG